MMVIVRLRTDLRGRAHVLDLLDQMLEVDLVEAAGAQQVRLRLRPGVDVAVVVLLRPSRSFNPSGHERPPWPRLLRFLLTRFPRPIRL